MPPKCNDALSPVRRANYLSGKIRLMLIAVGMIMGSNASAATTLDVGGVTFTWSSSGSVAGMECTQIHEVVDPDTWDDNYFCTSVDLGMQWSSAGVISGMNCTQIFEGADPNTWDDNFLCLPTDSHFRFRWSSAGPLGSNSIQWIEVEDPHTWNDNYLQIAFTPGDVCAGTLYSGNPEAQSQCPQVCNDFDLVFLGNWTNESANAEAAGCAGGQEAVCGCVRQPGDVCAGALYGNNTEAQAECPAVCAQYGLVFYGNWTNESSYVSAAGCNAGVESICGCGL